MIAVGATESIRDQRAEAGSVVLSKVLNTCDGLPAKRKLCCQSEQGTEQWIVETTNLDLIVILTSRFRRIEQ